MLNMRLATKQQETQEIMVRRGERRGGRVGEEREEEEEFVREE